MKNDALKALTEARPARLDPPGPPRPPGRLPDRLAAAMEEPPARRTARAAGPGRAAGPARAAGSGRGRRTRIALGFSGVTAAALVAVVALLVAAPGPPEPESAPVALSARSALLVAADGAGSASTGRYWSMRQVLTEALLVGPRNDRYVVGERVRVEMWLAPDHPRTPNRMGDVNLGAAPLREEDRAAWRRNGSPRSWWYVSTHNGHCAADDESDLCRGRRVGPPAPPRVWEPGERSSFWLIDGLPLTLDQITRLPGDPAGLRAHLRRAYERLGREAEPAAWEPATWDEWMWRTGLQLVVRAPVTPETRSATYRILADLPQVRSLGGTTDALGRAGTALAAPGRRAEGVTQVQLILDGRGRALGVREVLTTPEKGPRGDAYPAGVVLSERVVERAEWTDADPPAPAIRE
ncbi:hypothetical protein [Bailinhaonella thermotolerans]|uniref:Uncharacterized protein n=1 Tax=Bailinhaonella thermotolerans TaxID=1070861 RepID=A0A3A4B078_9ACTN|nr:hypothetical protein [Bailinhaonella thermotolerans]RJL30860.1 hypothetical protein D5H75_21385 [Bailinhaonella thermotolerans]